MFLGHNDIDTPNHWKRAEQTETNNQNEGGPAVGLKVGESSKMILKVEEKGASWNQKGTKSKPKGEKNASTNQDPKRHSHQIEKWRCSRRH